MLAAPAMVGTAPELGAHPGAGPQRPADHSAVALPVALPPGAPVVAAVHYADPARSGQVVMLRYPAFTLYACAGGGAGEATDPCHEPGAVLLRTVRRDGVVTRFSLAAAGPAPAGDLVRAVRAYVVRSELTTEPWGLSRAAARPTG